MISTLLCLDKNPVSSDNKQMALVNKRLIWQNTSNNKITITFDDPAAAWSLIGRQSSQQVPSMNLGWLDPPFPSPKTQKEFPNNRFKILLSKNGKLVSYESFFPTNIKRNGCNESMCRSGYNPGATVLHEFGHALGLYHEHQNYSKNNDGKTSNPVVYKSADQIRKIMIDDCVKANGTNCEKNTWPVETIQSNIIDRYSSGTNFLNGSCFDPKSIMRYPIDPRFMISGPEPSYNFVYSNMDKIWLQKYYPINKLVIIRVYFIDISEDEKWKVYWVIYCLCKDLVPIVGIQFNFYLNNEYLGHSNYIRKIKLNITKDQCEEKFTQETNDTTDEETSDEETKEEKQKQILDSVHFFLKVNTIFFK